jgi:Spy/CpxP family protein refolding chaperone
MDKISKSRWQIRTAALVIFLFGFAAGALALNAYHRWTGARMQNPRQGFERMLDRLQLSAEQKTQVQQIFSETRDQLQALRQESEPRVSEIRRQTDERLQKVLTPEQWKQFQQMRDEMRGRGRRGREYGGNNP